MTEEKKWKVETSRGFAVNVEADGHAVTENGHLEFSDGSIFARNEWSYVTPVNE